MRMAIIAITNRYIMLIINHTPGKAGVVNRQLRSEEKRKLSSQDLNPGSSEFANKE